MIQDVKLGTHRIGTYMYAISKCAFLLGFRLDIKFQKPRRKSSKSQCGKGCGHKKCSNGVAYDDSYCDKF